MKTKPIPTHSHANPIQSWTGLILLLGCTLFISWSGALDQLAEFNMDKALLQAGLMYGTARGINALVSMLQTTDISLVVVSMQIGQVLDPINDLIERFSDIMSIAIAALALQKILVIITAHSIFQILLSILAAGTMVSKWLKYPKIYLGFLKTFILFAFVRLAFAFIVLLNYGVDQLFLNEPTQQSYQAMQHYEQRLSNAEQTLNSKDESKGIMAWMQHKRDQISHQLNIKKQIDNLNQGVSHFAHQTLMLMTLLLLKSILFPLLFWWLLIQGIKFLWHSSKLKTMRF